MTPSSKYGFRVFWKVVLTLTGVIFVLNPVTLDTVSTGGCWFVVYTIHSLVLINLTSIESLVG